MVRPSIVAGMMRHLLLAAVTSAAIAVAPRVEAGCGFYAPPATASGAAIVNDADQVSLFREGNRVALTMSTNYKGPLEDFAMVVPVPVVLKEEAVKTLSPAIFAHLEKLTAPRVVERDERDPCFRAPQTDGVGAAPGGGAPGMTGAKGGAGGGHGVTVEAAFIVGEYEIVVLSAKESDGLEKWLVEHKYKMPEGAAAALAPYVTAQQKFVVAKVDKTKVKRDASGEVVLSPLRFVYETNDFRLPVRLGLLNAPKGGKQDLLIYILSSKRLETSNYPNVFIPTNVDVADSVATKLGPFYAALFDATLAKAGGRAVVTEYAYPANLCGEPCLSTALDGSELGKLGGDMVGKDLDASAYTLTRLHTRYDAATLSEDLVFKAADGVVGGRDFDPGAEGEFAKKAEGASAFQSRYVVRHPWQGPIRCDAPIRGVWLPRHGAGTPALSVAGSPREASLASLVVSPVAQLAIAGTTKKFGEVAVAPDVPKAAAPKKAKEPDEPPAAPSKVPWIVGATGAVILIALGLMFARRRPNGAA